MELEKINEVRDGEKMDLSRRVEFQRFREKIDALGGERGAYVSSHLIPYELRSPFSPPRTPSAAISSLYFPPPAIYGFTFKLQSPHSIGPNTMLRLKSAQEKRALECANQKP
ncbi:Hypothetical predicted protein [Olea europaea subsp. europaea]|uniref:Uncharacterized protein n=1 Tax=Olea europaea subsp. europaea TaxID=158383 RepID=A0A8S0V794_OLEEU|nr:Hypothetical predicted protein [Olea europaea subsp. europaea]